MKKKEILVVEDEADILEVIRFNLVRENFVVSIATDGAQALKAITRSRPDLVLLDLMLPGIDGLELCRQLKRDAQTATIPVIMVTAKGGESDIVTGLELGADDYIAKPFNIKVLVARVRAVLRRRQEASADPPDVIRRHDIVVDSARHEVLVKGRPVTMTFSELRILQLLTARPGFVMTREQIVDAVRGTDYAVTDRAVDVHIVAIRRKLGSKADLIETVRGVGYRFKE